MKQYIVMSDFINPWLTNSDSPRLFQIWMNIFHMNSLLSQIHFPTNQTKIIIIIKQFSAIITLSTGLPATNIKKVIFFLLETPKPSAECRVQ